MRFSLNGKAIVCLCLMAVAAAAFLQATRWPVQARLFPMLVSAPLFFLTLVEFAFNAFGSKEHREGGGGSDFQISGGHDPKVERKRTLWILAWCLIFFLLVVALGFPIAVPLFVFLYLKPHCKEGWGISLVLTFVAWVSFYGLFVKFLHVPFPDAWLQQGLRLAGVM